MPSLRSIANQYHQAANKIAARADRVGELTGNQKKAIDSYRDCALKIEALIRPEDSLPKEAFEVNTTSLIENLAPQKKVSTRDKAATPQELLEKANG
jgi:hypothetical protein